MPLPQARAAERHRIDGEALRLASTEEAGAGVGVHAPLRFTPLGRPGRDLFDAWRGIVGSTADVCLLQPSGDETSMLPLDIR